MDKQTESRKAFEECYLNSPNFTDNESWAWIFWQKSRESLVVELPKMSMCQDMTATQINEAIEECAEAIRAIGIRIKGEGDES